MFEQSEVMVSRVHRYHPCDWYLNFVFVFVLVLIANFRQPKQNANEKEKKHTLLLIFSLIKIQSLLVLLYLNFCAKTHSHD